MPAIISASDYSRFYLDAPRPRPKEALPAEKCLFLSATPAIQAKTARRATAIFYSPEQARKPVENAPPPARILATQTSSQQRVARVQSDSGISDCGASSDEDEGMDADSIPTRCASAPPVLQRAPLATPEYLPEDTPEDMFDDQPEVRPGATPAALAAPKPWYSGLGSFVRTQLSYVRDGFKVLLSPLSLCTLKHTAPSRPTPVPPSFATIARLTLEPGLKAAQVALERVRQVTDMDAFRKLDVRGFTSQYGFLDPDSNPATNHRDTGSAASNDLGQARLLAQDTFQRIIPSDAQDAFKKSQALLMPYGHVDTKGLRYIDTMPEPADFAAFKRAHIDALTAYIGPVNTLIKSLPPGDHVPPDSR